MRAQLRWLALSGILPFVAAFALGGRAEAQGRTLLFRGVDPDEHAGVAINQRASMIDSSDAGDGL